MMVNGSQILARSLRRLRVDTFFYIMGGPMMAAESASMEEGLRGIDVRHALGGRPGPVYLDMPGDLLYKQVEEDEVVYPSADECLARVRPGADPALIDDAIRLLNQAERPLVITGSGILWSGAEAELEQLVELAGLPFYTTPQGRGVVPDDHPLSFPTARATAFREADLLLVIGTRINYVISHLAPPRFNPAARLIQVDIDATEIG